MDNPVILKKIEALKFCSSRIEAKRPQDSNTLKHDYDIQDIQHYGRYLPDKGIGMLTIAKQADDSAISPSLSQGYLNIGLLKIVS